MLRHTKRFVPVLLLLAVLASSTRSLCGQDEPSPEPSAERSVPAVEADDTQAEPAEDGTTPVQPGPGMTTHAARLTGNFMLLLQRTSGDLLAFTGNLLLSCLLWSLGLAILGLALGLAIWYWLRRRKLLDAPWNWYRYVRWLWAVLFVLVPTLGFGYAGLCYGGGRCIKRYVLEERALDRIAADLICAAALDHADYEVRGDETVDDYARILNDAEGVDLALESDLQVVIDHLDEYGPSHPLKRWVLSFALTRILSTASDLLHGVDLRMVALILIEHRNLDEYLAGQGEPPRALVLFATQMKALRHETVSLINLTVYPQVFLGVASGLLLPLMLWGIFRLILYLCTRRTTNVKALAQVTPPQPAAPLQDETRKDPAC